MGHSPSPQRRRWVTEPEEIEPRPVAFTIKREGDRFIVEDPDAKIIRRRVSIIAEIHKEFPDVPLSALEDARVSYYDYAAIVEL